MKENGVWGRLQQLNGIFIKGFMALLFLLAWSCEVFAGKDLGVLQPWTPVTVREDAVGVEVGVWDRTHTFAKAALPISVTAKGKELLAAPIRLVAKVNNKTVVWRSGGNLVLCADSEQATVSSWQSCDEVTVDTSTRF
jgi:hypothetical protein